MSVLAFASAPFILRAAYKDQYLVETLVTEPLAEVVSTVFGARFANQHDATVVYAGALLYYVASSVLGGQTPGEEFCDSLQVTPTSFGGNVLPTTKLRKLVLAVFLAFQGPILQWIAKRIAPTRNPTDVVAIIKKLSNALFYLTDVYVTLPHRFAGVQYVSTQHRASGRNGPGSYVRYGVLQLLELILTWYSSRGQTPPAAPDSVAGQSARSMSDDDDDGNGVCGHCTLCLGTRKHPTATACGHIFCWDCITAWVQGPQPICPLCRQHVDMKQLVPLVQYVAPT